MNEQRTITNPFAVGPSDRKVERLLKTINLQPSLSTDLSTAATSAFLSKAGEADLVLYTTEGPLQHIKKLHLQDIYESFYHSGR